MAVYLDALSGQLSETAGGRPSVAYATDEIPRVLSIGGLAHLLC
jgi:hypothetical protein